MICIVMGPGQKFLTWVGSNFCFLGWAGLQPSLVWDWKFSPKNPNFFWFFALRVKKISSGWIKKYPGETGSASYLLQVKSMLGSVQGPSLDLYENLYYQNWLKLILNFILMNKHHSKEVFKQRISGLRFRAKDLTRISWRDKPSLDKAGCLGGGRENLWHNNIHL